MAETEAEKAKQIVLLLVGPPESGKTTFCDNVMRSSRRPWSHVCQGTLDNGKIGTKTQCLNMAINSLKEGKSVFIDRCNIGKEQRLEFINLGSPEVEVHAVVLEIPDQVCINRLVKRIGHDNNLQRQRAALTVNRIVRQKKLPEVKEGFSRIMFCYNDTDVQNAVNTYNMLGPKDNLPPGCFGLQDSDSKINAPPSSSNAANTIPETNETTTRVRVSPSADNVPTLAFPSISTEDYQFDPVKASDVIIEKVEEFLLKHGTARFILVALSDESEILSLVKTKASQKNIESTRFFTYVGDITKLHSIGGLHCNVIANPATWELKPGGEGVNGAIFMAAGPDLEAATNKCCGNMIFPGQAVAVPLSPTCPLYSEEGITHVIHVLGPNMDPDQTSYIHNNYIIGCNILREAYTSLFETFLSLLQVQPKSPKRLKQTTGSESGENIVEENDKIIWYKAKQDPSSYGK